METIYLYRTSEETLEKKELDLDLELTYESAIELLNQLLDQHLKEKGITQKQFCADNKIPYPSMSRLINKRLEQPKQLGHLLTLLGMNVQIERKYMVRISSAQAFGKKVFPK